MTLVVYRPELENPPRDAALAFIVGEEAVTLNPGVNRDLSDDVWAILKQQKLVEALLRIGAIEEMNDTEEVESIAQDTDITALAYSTACSVIERCHDVELLQQWQTVDQRIRVRNAIARRIQQIQEGNA